MNDRGPRRRILGNLEFKGLRLEPLLLLLLDLLVAFLLSLSLLLVLCLQGTLDPADHVDFLFLDQIWVYLK